MRLRSLSATALAAAAVFQSGTYATAQIPAVDVSNVRVADLVQDGASTAPASSATTTWTITRTVMRVVQTQTATRNATLPTLASASLTLTPYVNGTASVLGTSATPTSSQVSHLPSGAASYLSMDVAGVVAVAGFIRLLVA